jgi:hypothetical protein
VPERAEAAVCAAPKRPFELAPKNITGTQLRAAAVNDPSTESPR